MHGDTFREEKMFPIQFFLYTVSMVNIGTIMFTYIHTLYFPLSVEGQGALLQPMLPLGLLPSLSALLGIHCKQQDIITLEGLDCFCKE